MGAFYGANFSFVTSSISVGRLTRMRRDGECLFCLSLKWAWQRLSQNTFFSEGLTMTSKLFLQLLSGFSPFSRKQKSRNLCEMMCSTFSRALTCERLLLGRERDLSVVTWKSILFVSLSPLSSLRVKAKEVAWWSSLERRKKGHVRYFASLHGAEGVAPIWHIGLAFGNIERGGEAEKQIHWIDIDVHTGFP